MKATVKKVWSVTWKTLTSISLLLIVIACGCLLNEYFHSWEFQQRYRSNHVDKIYPASSSTYMIEWKGGHGGYYRTVDALTGKKLSPKLKYIYIGRVKDTLTVFQDKKGKRGYLNAYTGQIALPAQYEHAWVFSEGLAAVTINNNLGFIDHSGNWAIAPRFRFAGENIEYVFKRGLCTVKDSCGKFGLIDHNGNFVLQPEYTYIRSFKNGCRVLNKGNLKGLYCDSTRQIILACEYNDITFSDEGITLTRDGRKWMVSHDLKTIVYPYLFDGQNTFTVYLNEEDEYGNNKHYEYQPIGYYSIQYCLGLLDRRTGKPITPAIYKSIQYVTPDLFDCELAGGYTENHIFINAKGEMVKL